jgi:hypothetical protein
VDTGRSAVPLLTTLSGSRVRLRLPPEAAPGRKHAKIAAGPMGQSRGAHRSAWPLHSSRGGQWRSRGARVLLSRPEPADAPPGGPGQRIGRPVSSHEAGAPGLLRGLRQTKARGGC